MSNEVKLDRDAMELMSKILAELVETRRTVEALTMSLGIADNVPAIITTLRERDEAAEATKKRRRVVSLIMAGCNAHGATARREWLTERLARDPKHGPITDEDLDYYKLRDDPTA